MKIVSRAEPLKHYTWGVGCDSWNLVDGPALSVKLERMPPYTAEQWHYHGKARQFFYILKGMATFETEQKRICVQTGQGIEIVPGARHRILNEGAGELEFILSSQPSTTGDRINCESIGGI